MNYYNHLRYSLLLFLLITFSILNSFWFVSCNSFSKNVPIVPSPLRSLISYVHNAEFLTFLITKSFFRPIWNVTFCKNVFIFWRSYIVTKFKLRVSLLIFFTRVNLCALFYISGLNFNRDLICIVEIIHCII